MPPLGSVTPDAMMVPEDRLEELSFTTMIHGFIKSLSTDSCQGREKTFSLHTTKPC